MPKKNIIVFESHPDISDNALYVFNEMIRRGYNKKYKLVWALNDDKSQRLKEKIKNVYYISHYSYAFKDIIKRLYVLSSAKLLISSNNHLKKYSNKTKHINLEHGAAIKNCSKYYTYPDDIDVVTELSQYLIEPSARSVGFYPEKYIVTGLPRNDGLFKKKKIDFFKEKYDKIILWLPTFRQHKHNENICLSSIAIPIIRDIEKVKLINECAKKYNVLLLLKPHPAQDVSKIEQYSLSHLKVIDDEFINRHNYDLYEFLGNCDALITDYSSVYYDFLLCDKPIGLAWDDYDEYEKNEGFVVDMETVMAGGVKIYDVEELCEFICDVKNDVDRLNIERNDILRFTHKYKDNKSSKRAVDYIEKECL